MVFVRRPVGSCSPGCEADGNTGCFSQAWLERTPGLDADGFNFWERLEINIFKGLNQEKEKIEVRDESSWGAEVTDGGGYFFYSRCIISF